MKKLSFYFVTTSIFAFSFQGNSQTTSTLSALDSNTDGIINPYEALDVLLILKEEIGGDLKVADLENKLAEFKKEEKSEFAAEFKKADKNNDGIIQFKEVDEETLQFIALMDTDRSESITADEMANFSIEKAFFLSDEAINEEVSGIFTELNAKNDSIELTSLPEEIRSSINSLDLNSDGKITREEATVFLKANSSEAAFTVKGDVAYMTGTICTSTPAKVLELIFTHPEVKTIEMQIVPGSINDVANLRASFYVHKFGLNTRIKSNSMIASGGTDFFLAGHKREVEKGAIIGVHSWAGGTISATDLPKDDEAHNKYLEYYRALGISEDFYWYTLEASPASSIHNMTEEEIKKYNVRN